jgi:hypothetical protein
MTTKSGGLGVEGKNQEASYVSDPDDRETRHRTQVR